MENRNIAKEMARRMWEIMHAPNNAKTIEDAYVIARQEFITRYPDELSGVGNQICVDAVDSVRRRIKEFARDKDKIFSSTKCRIEAEEMMRDTVDFF